MNASDSRFGGPPSLPMDLADDRRLLPVLRYVILALLLGPLLTVVALGSSVPERWLNMLAPPLIFAVGVGGAYLIRQHRIGTAIRFMVNALWLVIAGIALGSGGVMSPVVVVFPIVILMAGWLINSKAAQWLTFGTVLLTVGLFAAGEQGWLPTEAPPPAAVYMVHQVIACLLATALIVFVIELYSRHLNELSLTQDRLTARTFDLKRSEERYRVLIEWSPEPILVHRNGQILYVNPAALELFGAMSMAELLCKTTQDLIHPDERATQNKRMQSIVNREHIMPKVESRFLRLDGTVVDVEVQGTAIDYDGEPAIHVVMRDITRRKHMEEQVKQLAFFDALTQLPNRRLLQDRLAQAIAANRRSNHFGAVMFLDLDNFKPLNDQFGHTMGDLLLIEVAHRLKSCVREMDTVARFGGDEFVVVIDALTDTATESVVLAQKLAEKISHSLSEPYHLTPPDDPHARPIVHHCTASIGVVMMAQTDTTPDELVKWADAAMYGAKALGRNRIHFSDLDSTAQLI